MLERLLAAIAIGIIRYLDGRALSGADAADANADKAAMRRAGNRVRDWLRKQDGTG